MPPTAPREFGVYTVLSVTHGLPIELDPYLDILTHITGQKMDVVTAIRARQVSAPWLLEQHPRLSEFVKPERFSHGRFSTVDYPAMDAWAKEVAAALGRETLPVQPLPPGEWTRRPLVEEVLDHAPPEKVFVIDPKSLIQPRNEEAPLFAGRVGTLGQVPGNAIRCAAGRPPEDYALPCRL